LPTLKRPGIVTLLAAIWLCISGSQSAAQTDTITKPTATFTTLHSFDGTDGNKSFAGLLQATNGNLYGTTYYGGANDSGELFEISPSGVLSTVHSFCSSNLCGDGEYTYAIPVQGTDGNFYGTTYLGGSDSGTVFKVTPGGKLTTLHTFNGADGSQPLAGLVQATDGNFYGTTYAGGSNGDGEIFKITPTGTLTILHNFCSQSTCQDGANPFANLIQGVDGDLYGTTLTGGTRGVGTVFRISLTGTLKTLHSFCLTSGCPDGDFPQTGLVQASNGNFYGTTIIGGANDSGTIFEITPGGTLTTIYSACSKSGCADGNYLYAPLIQATDGNLYGITQIGGANNNGTIFRLTPAGSLTTLYSFCSQPGCADGEYPAGSLVQITDGTLYGTTPDGGANGFGTVFRLSVALKPFVETRPSTAKVGAAINILGTNLTGSTKVTFNGKAATFTVISKNLITSTVPAGASTGQLQVTTPTGVLNSNVNFRIQP
jgi:uncharacterized repeat protein (TIGR03803 family)